MKQLVEVRFNPVEFPGKSASEAENIKGHELIFIASRIGYQVGLNGQASQVQETEVWRCMTTPVALANAAGSLLLLLEPGMRQRVLDAVASHIPQA